MNTGKAPERKGSDATFAGAAPAPAGSVYEAEVPDTLDLAEHARLAINALTGHLEPDKHYAVYQTFYFDKEPRLGGLTWNLPAKDARVLPMLRAITGSTQNMDIESGLMRALLGQIGKDGLAYSPLSIEGAPQGTVYPYPNGLLALAMLNWHERDGDPAWLERFRRLTTTLAKIVIREEDRAYWPPESSYRPDGTWAYTTRGAAKIPYQPPEEPYLEQQGTEGCVKYEQAAELRALVARYRLDRDPEALDVARRVVRFMLKPGMWEDKDAKGNPGNQHGVFAVWGCCTANGAVGLYYAWHGITRFDETNGAATVNLLLNRAAPWLDVDSWLPYEGRVVIRNKQSKSVLVRLPYWVDRNRLTCFVDEKPVRLALAGNRLVFGNLTPRNGERKGSVIRLEFPVPTAVEKHTVLDREYTLTFRGSTLVDIAPRDTTPGRYRYYLRDGMKQDKAPMKTVERFVAEQIIGLQ